jgi:hypothetical protein
MKDVKDFDVNEFLSDGKPTDTTVAIGGTQPSKWNAITVATSTSKPSAPTIQGEAIEKTVPAESSEYSMPSQQTAHTQSIEPTQPAIPQRTSTRHRRASLDEYRATFLSVPRITDRQSVFVSRDVRDKIDSVVRRLGERKMSVSGFLENLARHHLDLYADDLEQWKRL